MIIIRPSLKWIWMKVLQRQNFRRNVLPPSSRRRGSRPFFPERSGNFYHTSWCYMPEVYIIHSLLSCESQISPHEIACCDIFAVMLPDESFLIVAPLCWNFHYTVHLTWPTHYILCRFSCLNFATRMIFSFAVACWSAWSQCVCIYIYIYIYNFFVCPCGPTRATVSFLMFLDHTWHTHTHTVGALWTRGQLVAETSAWQHTTLTINLHATGDIRTHNLMQASGRRPTP